jgi:cytochrome P450/NADPH-cytochrome P450 reductase
VDLVTVPLKTTQAAVLLDCLNSLEEKHSLQEVIAASKLALPAKYTLLGTLQMYHSWTHFPLAKVMPVLPTLAPRYYSVLSSPLKSTATMKIAFTVVGVCTRYMDTLTDTDLRNTQVSLQFMVQHDPSVFYTAALHTPKILMVCNGVGVTPFVGLLSHLVRLNRSTEVWLLFGCRQGERNTEYLNYDFLYEDKLKALLSTLNGRLLPAFSRGLKPQYVQDILIAETPNLQSFLPGAVVLLCGSFDMKQVSEFLQKLHASLEVLSE